MKMQEDLVHERAALGYFTWRGTVFLWYGIHTSSKYDLAHARLEDLAIYFHQSVCEHSITISHTHLKSTQSSAAAGSHCDTATSIWCNTNNTSTPFYLQQRATNRTSTISWLHRVINKSSYGKKINLIQNDACSRQTAFITLQYAVN